jgi:hypothetical protein
VQFHVFYDQNLVGMCAGDQCTQVAAGMLEKKSPALVSKLSPEAGKLFAAESLLVGYLNFGQVLDAVSALDASAMGEGGMMVKMILDMAIGVVKNLRELTTVVRILPDGMAIAGHLHSSTFPAATEPAKRQRRRCRISPWKCPQARSSQWWEPRARGKPPCST